MRNYYTKFYACLRDFYLLIMLVSIPGISLALNPVDKATYEGCLNDHMHPPADDPQPYNSEGRKIYAEYYCHCQINEIIRINKQGNKDSSESSNIGTVCMGRAFLVHTVATFPDDREASKDEIEKHCIHTVLNGFGTMGMSAEDKPIKAYCSCVGDKMEKLNNESLSEKESGEKAMVIASDCFSLFVKNLMSSN